MKYLAYILCLWTVLCFSACETLEEVAPSTYDCQLALPTQSDTHPKREALEAAMETVGRSTVGVQVAITTPDGLTWTGASGMADLNEGIALEPCHKTMVGSISKVYTAVLIMQLQDEGILNVNDSLKQWLDQSLIGEIANANEVTLRHLLLHTSGIRDYLGIKQYVTALNTPFFRETQQEKLKYIYGKSAELPVDEKYSYSNTNYVLLGLVVEEARKMTLWDAMDTYIFDPLGLDNSEMGTHEAPIPAGTARPYRQITKGKYQDIMHTAVSDAATGDGGVAANMQEVNAFIEGLFSGKLMSDAAFKQMTEDLILVGEGFEDFPQWDGESYGLGISLWNTPYGKAYGHTGSTASYDAFMFYFIDQKATISIGYNGQTDAEGWDMRRALREQLFELVLE